LIAPTIRCTGIKSDGSFTATLFYTTDDEEALPLDVLLIVTVEEGGEYLNPLTVTPENPVTIARNTNVPITVTLELIEGLDALPPEGEVKISIAVQDAVTEEILAESFEFKWECEQELPEEEDPDDDDGDKCTRDKEHPHARTLADEYGEAVGLGEGAYDQIWTWFCEDILGFGEIELGFKLYLEYGEALGLDIYEIIDIMKSLKALRPISPPHIRNDHPLFSFRSSIYASIRF